MLVAAALSLLWQAGFSSGKVAAAHEITEPAGKPGADAQKNDAPDVEGEAAMVSANAAVWQTVINAFGLFGLLATILYARRAWLAARDSADADNEALRLTKESLRNAKLDAVDQERLLQKQLETAQRQAAIAAETATYQLRAYVDICDMKIRAHEHDTWLTWYDFTFHLRNFGQTPAFDVIAVVTKLPHPAKDDVTVTNEVSPHRYGNIAPSDFILGTTRFSVPVGDEPRIASGELRHTFVLKVSYLDIYKVRRETELTVEAGQHYEPRSVGETHQMT